MSAEHVLIPYRTEHVSMAQSLIREMRANGGLAPLDLERFWADQEISAADPFGFHIPQVSFGAQTNCECVFDELGIAEDHWRYEKDEAWALELNKAYNDKAEGVIGRRLLPETPHDPALRYPPVKGLHDVFEARNVWHDRSWWLMRAASTPDELKALLDRVEARDVRHCILPENWQEEKKRLMALGVKPPLYRGQRGPVTFATSIYGPEDLIFLIMEDPDLAGRLRDNIIRVMLEIARILDEEAGYTHEAAPRGFAFCDDNCCLLTPEMYEFFGLPVLRALYERYSPDPGDLRYQHSDSAMGHLLPLLARVNLNRTNFGPTVAVREIREHLPGAIIDGQLAPFTYSRNEEENIVLEFLRDLEMAREKRGLNFATAGSVNNGSRLTGMRLIMAAIQRYGRYA